MDKVPHYDRTESIYVTIVDNATITTSTNRGRRQKGKKVAIR